MSLELRHLSPAQIKQAAPGIVRKFESLGYMAVEQTIDDFQLECKTRGHHRASRTKYVNTELVDNRFMVDIQIVPVGDEDVLIEYRYKDSKGPSSAPWEMITQTLGTFNIHAAIASLQ